MSAEAKAALSAALRAKWASGTRKKNPRSAFEKAAATRRRRIEGGEQWGFMLPQNRSFEACSRGGRSVSDKQMEKARQIGEAKRGKQVIGGKNGRGTDHWKSKFWMLWSPQRDLVCGVNLNEIVRRNAHLFAPEDLRAHGSGTVASHGLHELFRLRKGRNGAKYIVSSWKGWCAVDRAEMVKAVEIPKGYVAMWKPDLQDAKQ